jgi:APA family basic amino acid/polyamine antiporter
MFAWSLDRLLPDKLSEVNERFHSPVYSVVLVAILAEIFLTLYALGIFQFLSPFLAYAVVFTFVSIAGILFPFLKKTSDIYQNSGVSGRVFGIPWFTIAGSVGVVYWLVALYYALTTPLLGLNGQPTLILTALEFLVPFALYFVIRAARKTRGLIIDRAFQVIPPE